METVLNTAAPIFAGACVLGALYFFIRGLRSRGVPQTAYGVARVEARQSMLLSFFGAIFLLILGLIVFGVYGFFGFDLLPEVTESEPGGTLTPTLAVTDVPVEVTAGVSPTGEPTTSPVNLENLPTSTNTPAPPTESPTPSQTPTPATPTPTFTPDVDTAVVNSPNGLWLREAPGGTQEVELIPDGTVLIVLDGRETVDDLEWQQVRTPAGNEGWVAVDFIIYQ